MVRFFFTPVVLAVWMLAAPSSLLADDQGSDTQCDELASDGLSLPPAKKAKAARNRTPLMIGDFIRDLDSAFWAMRRSTDF